jgi:hypothetical protein
MIVPYLSAPFAAHVLAEWPHPGFLFYLIRAKPRLKLFHHEQLLTIHYREVEQVE